MLSRTADNLFWLARYTERAGNMARGLGVASRMAAISARLGDEVAEWRALLTASGGDAGFYKKYETPSAESVVHCLVFDPDNPSSILFLLRAARRNARAVRTALTVEMWESAEQSLDPPAQTTVARRDRGRATAACSTGSRNAVTLFSGAAHQHHAAQRGPGASRGSAPCWNAPTTPRASSDVKHELLRPGRGGRVD